METKTKEQFTQMLIERIAKKIGVDISEYNMEEMVMGMAVELEHGTVNDDTNITSDDAVMTFQIVLAHVREIADYYTRLAKMENETKSVSKDEKPEDNQNDDDSEEIKLNEAKRFKELCGLVENVEKKQLTNKQFRKTETKKILSEQLNLEEFDVVEFKKDDIGSEIGDEEKELYKMDEKKDKPIES